MAPTDLALLYRDSRTRVVDLVSQLTAEELAAPVPACPAWSVHDVVSHLVGVIEDAVAGRLSGPPNDEQTSEEVARHRGTPTRALLSEWSELSPQFETFISELRVWPGVIDVVSHEHDIRGALGRPGDRESDGVRLSARALLRSFEPPRAVALCVDGQDMSVGPEGEPAVRLTTTSFETLRFRMGRRSRAQLAAFSWSGDPSPVLDHLVVFGPAQSDIIE